MSIKPSRGRSYWGNINRDKEYARKIYDLRKQEGSFPEFDWEIWEILYYLENIVEMIIETDKGVSNQLDRINEKLKIPLSRQALQQIYLGDSARGKLSHRRLLVLKDLAHYCLDYWKNCFDWKS